MTILLDSHVAMWFVGGNPRLGPESRSRIAATPRVMFSAMSIFELTIKSMMGRFVLPDGLVELLTSQGLSELPLSAADAAGLSHFPELGGHDPFDRALVAQAHNHGLKFLTADRRLLALGHDWIIDATQ